MPLNESSKHRWRTVVAAALIVAGAALAGRATLALRPVDKQPAWLPRSLRTDRATAGAELVAAAALVVAGTTGLWKLRQQEANAGTNAAQPPSSDA